MAVCIHVSGLFSPIYSVGKVSCLWAIPVLALPAPWARFLRCPLTAIQTHTKQGKGYNEITIY